MIYLIITMYIVFNALISNEVSISGKHKEIGSTKAFLFSFLFSPIIGSLLVLISHPVDITDEEIELPSKISVGEIIAYAVIFSIIMLGVYKLMFMD